MSLPFMRRRPTRQARPTQASHAPNVSRMRMRVVSAGLFFLSSMGMVRISVRIVASRARRAMSRCFRWVVMARSVVIEAKGRIEVRGKDIAKRLLITNLRLTRPALEFKLF